MKETFSLFFFLSLHAILIFSAAGVHSTTLKLANECSFTVWPGLVSGHGTPPLSTTTFTLAPGGLASISIPAASWSGQLWARTLCSYDSTGGFTCLTGDCGTGSAECGGALTVPLATVAKFNMSGNGGLDFYSVSATHGYNLAMLVVPQGDYEGNCMASACVDDLNGGCPSEASSGCTATCFAFGDPKNCCSGDNARPGICKPSEYSLYFGSRCPWAYSYVYDEDDEKEKSRAFACSLADYLITFCPRPSLAIGHQVAAGSETPPSSRWNSKQIIIIILVIVTMVVAILLTVLKIVGPRLAIGAVSAIYTALALLFAL